MRIARDENTKLYLLTTQEINIVGNYLPHKIHKLLNYMFILKHSKNKHK